MNVDDHHQPFSIYLMSIWLFEHVCLVLLDLYLENVEIVNEDNHLPIIIMMCLFFCFLVFPMILTSKKGSIESREKGQNFFCWKIFQKSITEKFFILIFINNNVSGSKYDFDLYLDQNIFSHITTTTKQHIAATKRKRRRRNSYFWNSIAEK